jgi:hypothetical protein
MAMDDAWLITAFALDDTMDQGLWNAMNLGLARDHFVIGIWPIGRCRNADRAGERSNDRAQMIAPHSRSSSISRCWKGLRLERGTQRDCSN